MKLAAATVGMDATRSSREWEQQVNSIEAGTGDEPFSLRFSQALAATTESVVAARSFVGAAPATAALPPAVDDDRLLRRLAEELIGQPLQVKRSLLDRPAWQAPLLARSVRLSASTVYHHEESLLFAASGRVTTEDGREIAFDLGMSLTSRTTVTRSVTALGAALIDPLILQFEGDMPLIGEGSFTFDLDGDGSCENLSRPGAGCGFLAFDRNGDGVINDGLELFGPHSGSGFAELAELDSDANLWIDENDPIFSQLSVWRQDEDGGSQLLSLAEAGVGAIAVSHAGTEFSLRASNGEVVANLAAASIFLTEGGEVRPLLEIDLAVNGGEAATSAGAAFATDSAATAARPDLPALASWGSLAASAAPGERHGHAPLSPETLEAIGALRQLIGMQRLRLRLLLLGRRHSEAERLQAEPRDPLFSWLTRQESPQAARHRHPGDAPRGGRGEFSLSGA